MKSFGVIVVVLAAVVLETGAQARLPQYRPIYTPLVEECRENVTVTDQDVEDVLTLKTELSPAAACLTACADEKYGFIQGGKYGVYPDTRGKYLKLVAGDDDAKAKVEMVLRICFKTGPVTKNHSLR